MILPSFAVLAITLAAAPEANTAIAADPPNPDWNCEEQTMQQEMNWCAAQDYFRADEALNAQWTITADAMKARDANWFHPHDDRPGFYDQLLTAQRTWIAYRDANCTSEGYWARGGSMESMLVSTCKTKLTEERTQHLQFLIEQQ